MSYGVRIGTTEAAWIGSNSPPVGWVRYDGDLPTFPIWDAGINNIREMTAAEKTAAVSAAATAAAKKSKSDAISGIDAGDTPTASELDRMVRGLALVVLDEVNRLRAQVPHRIVSITRSGTVATVTTEQAHGLAVGNTVSVNGADQAGYNAPAAPIATVPSATTFTVNGVGSTLTTPATGSIYWTRQAVGATPDYTVQQLIDAVKAKIVAFAE